MFTSRAEHRLTLRQDNARFRLLDHAKLLGISHSVVLGETERLSAEIESEKSRLRTIYSDGASLAQILKRPEMKYDKLPLRHKAILDPAAIEQVEVSLKYEGYIERERLEIDRFQKLEAQRIPNHIDYFSIKALRKESQQKLDAIRPETMGQALRISGVNPADVGILSIWIKRLNTQNPVSDLAR